MSNGDTKIREKFIREDTWSDFSKGCVLYNDYTDYIFIMFSWNKHETGGKIRHIQAICKTRMVYVY